MRCRNGCGGGSARPSTYRPDNFRNHQDRPGRAADGLLYAAVGYPDWVDDDTVTWFVSADEGKTWQQAP